MSTEAKRIKNETISSHNSSNDESVRGKNSVVIMKRLRKKSKNWDGVAEIRKWRDIKYKK